MEDEERKSDVVVQRSPGGLHVVGSFSRDDGNGKENDQESGGVLNLREVPSEEEIAKNERQADVLCRQLLFDLDAPSYDLIFEDPLDSDLPEQYARVELNDTLQTLPVGLMLDSTPEKDDDNGHDVDRANASTDPGILYLDRRKSLRQTPTSNKNSNSFNHSDVELEDLRQKYDDLVVYAGYLSSERDMYKRKLEETILAWNKERAERENQPATEGNSSDEKEIPAVDGNDALLTDVDRQFLERMELQTQSDLYQAKKVEGFKDQGLQKTMQNCVEIRRTLKQVGNPEVDRKLKVAVIRNKQKKPLGVLGVLGLTDDKLQDKRSSLKHIEGEAELSNVEKLKKAVMMAENKLQESLSSLKPVAISSDCQGDQTPRNGSSTLESTLQDRRISLNRTNGFQRQDSKEDITKQVEQTLQQRLSSLKRVDSFTSRAKETMESEIGGVETTLRDTRSNLKRVDDGMNNKPESSIAAKEVEYTLQSTLNKLRRVDIDSPANKKSNDDRRNSVESVLQDRRTSLKPIEIQPFTDETDENTPSQLLVGESQRIGQGGALRTVYG